MAIVDFSSTRKNLRGEQAVKGTPENSEAQPVRLKSMEERGRLFFTEDSGDLFFADLNERTKERLPRVAVPLPRGSKIKSLHSMKSSTYILLETGEAYRCFGRSVEKVPLGEPVKDVKVNSESVLFLTSGGRVFGMGACHPLGIGEPRDTRFPINAPTQMLLPDGFSAVQIALGENHTLVLGHEGTVMGCGDGRCGELGRSLTGHADVFYTPVEVELPWRVRAIAVDARERVSCVTDQDGKRHFFGRTFGYGRAPPPLEDVFK